MAKKTDKNPRGAGRPKIPDELKKVNLTVKVPGWVKDRIVEGEINASGFVSGLLVGYFKGKKK